MGIMEGFFGFGIFDLGNFLGWKILASISLGGDFWRIQNKLNVSVHQLRAENLGLWLTRGEQPKHVTY